MNRWICRDLGEEFPGRRDLSGMVVDYQYFEKVFPEYYLTAGDVRKMKPGHMFACLRFVLKETKSLVGRVCDFMEMFQDGTDYLVVCKTGEVGSLDCIGTHYEHLSEWPNEEKFKQEIENLYKRWDIGCIGWEAQWEGKVLKNGMVEMKSATYSPGRDTIPDKAVITWAFGKPLIDMKYMGMMPK